jgi:Kef-type K+ transport system membrane component KefB
VTWAAVGAAVSIERPVVGAAVDESVTTALLGIFILFVAAKIGEEVARRLGQPGVVGELAGGFLVGPFALGWVVPGESAQVLAQIGVAILLFTVGLEVRTDQLLAVGRPAVLSAVLAMILPIAFGMAVALGIGQTTGSAAFVGLALAATSIGITSRVLADLGVLDRTFARVILGAAIVDDVLALIAIGVVSGVATGDLSASTLVVGLAGLGLVVLGFAVARRVRGLRREVFTWPLFADTPLVPAMILMLGLALVAELVGLAAIIGAFVAGLIVAETEAQDELQHEVKPLVAIFTPFFFAVTGAAVDLRALFDPQIALLVIVLTLGGIATKLAGGYLGSRRLGRAGALAVGVGLVPRGEVGIVVAGLGLGFGLLDEATFSAVLVAVVATTIVAPILLARVVPAAAAAESAASSIAATTPAASS